MVEHRDNKAAARLRELGVGGILLRMARDGQILEIGCEMPRCYCPRDRKHFDEKAATSVDWKLSFDHYPQLEADGGTREPGNARLAHALCNRVDYGHRLKVRRMLNQGLSLEQIADRLNRAKVRAPHGERDWTASKVRKAQVS